MKNKRHLISAVCELLIVFLVTAAAFLLGMIVAQAERGYIAFGGEYLLLLIPPMYYIGKQIFIDWAADIRKKVKRW